MPVATQVIVREARGMRLVCILVVVTAVFLSTDASARIVPQRSIKGARLGMTVEEVRDRLGPPSSVIFEHDPIQGRIRVYKYGLTYVSFGGTDIDATVNAVSTRSPRERTKRGVGVGSTRAAVARLVHGARCRVEGGLDHCYVGSFSPGHRVTDFRIGSSGRVRQVIVGFVID
jgi:hypothetical protein